MWITSSISTARTPTVVALGNFDGVHRGHRRVIQPVLQPANDPEMGQAGGCEQWAACQFKPAPIGGYSDRAAGLLLSSAATGSALQPSPAEDVHPIPTVLTFFPHPHEFFSGQPRRLLTPLDEKAFQLQAMGIEQLVLLPFNHELANLTPRSFVETILVERLQVRHVSVGSDFCFGRQRSGTAEDLRTIAADYGIPVSIVSLQTHGGERISSSAIRQALLDGALEQIPPLLGRPYSLTGRVVHGQHLGRTLGFPTANLRVSSDKFLPRPGVYSVKVYGATAHFGDPPLRGVMNLGCRPTVDGTQQTIEVHILNWTGHLYGRLLTVCLEAFLRPERKFDSLDALKSQIEADCAIALETLAVGDHIRDWA